MDLDDAVHAGYLLLTPKGLGDRIEDAMNRKFWKAVLEPAQKAEGNWLGAMFPDDANSCGALKSPLGKMKDAKAIAEENSDRGGWECYYLSHKCRKHAKLKTKKLMKENMAKVERQLKYHEDFKAALSKTPSEQWQGAGTFASADYWAKTSAPVFEKTAAGAVQKVPPKQAATLTNTDSDPRILEWHAQCRHLPEFLPVVDWNLHKSKDPVFDAQLAVGRQVRSYIHEPSGRWLECLGGYEEPKPKEEKRSWFQRWFSRGEDAEGTDGKYVRTPPLTKQFFCRPYHEEPISNCEHCPFNQSFEPSHFKCLAPGWTGVPSGEYTPVRSLLRPVSPERPDSDAVLAAREMSRPKDLQERNETGDLSKRLRCIHIGKPGEIQSMSADRIIYAAAEMPAPALTCVATTLLGPLQITASSQCQSRRRSKRFL